MRLIPARCHGMMRSAAGRYDTESISQGFRTRNFHLFWSTPLLSGHLEQEKVSVVYTEGNDSGSLRGLVSVQIRRWLPAAKCVSVSSGGCVYVCALLRKNLPHLFHNANRESQLAFGLVHQGSNRRRLGNFHSEWGGGCVKPSPKRDYRIRDLANTTAWRPQPEAGF